MTKIAAYRRARRIRRGKTSRVNRIVPREQTRITQVHMDLHHIAKRSSVRLQNGNNVINGLLRLLLNAVADQPAMDRVDRTRSANEIAGTTSPRFRVSPAYSFKIPLISILR